MSAQSTWVERIRSGERRAIARAITAIENDTGSARGLRAALGQYRGSARVIGVTGPPGSGKSTLVSALIRELLARDRRIAVLAFDPSSPMTGGAVLGDRIRMGDMQGDDRVFIRSIAARGHLGGLARNAAAMVQVFDAADFDDVVIETVGAGQSEVEVASVASTRVVVCPPGMGDEVQALKAGILEIADVFVVNKADLPDAERTERELRAMLALRPRPAQVPVLKTVATSGSGVGALADWLQQREVGKPRESRGMTAAEPQVETQARLLVDRLFARDSYARHLGLELVDAAQGSATVRLRVRAEHINFWNACHGGAIFSLADTALGLACNSYGSLAALIDAHMTFSVAVKEGEWLTARAVESSRTRKLAVYRIDVKRDDDALVASLTGTVFLTGRSLPADPV